MNAVLKKELHSYFSTPVGYIFIAAIVMLSGLAFKNVFAMGSPDVSYVFIFMLMFYMLLIPVLTMKLFSEEKRLKTDQILFTAPTNLLGIVMGKFLAAFIVFCISISINFIYTIVISFFTAPDWLVFFGNMLGAMLLGTLIISIGIFVSSLTESQLAAVVITMAVSAALILLDALRTLMQNSLVNRFIDRVSVQARYTTFTHGIIDYSNIVFFLGIAAVFLFLTVRNLERKRWI